MHEAQGDKEQIRAGIYALMRELEPDALCLLSDIMYPPKTDSELGKRIGNIYSIFIARHPEEAK